VPSQHQHRTGKKHLKKYAFLIIALITAIFVSMYFLFFQQSPMAQQMERYARTLTSEYTNNLRYFSPETLTNFPFYSSGSYEATAIISSNFGTALVLSPSSWWSFKSIETNLRAEDAIFGEDNSKLPTQFIFNLTGIGISGMGNNTIKNIGILVENGSSVIIKNIKIDSTFYYCLIIKGTNQSSQSSQWDSNTAIKDSEDIFDADLYVVLNKTDAFRELYAEPYLNSRIIEVLTKWSNAINSQGKVIYTPEEKEHDLSEIIRIAETQFGIVNASDLVYDTLAYFQQANLPTPQPQKTVFAISVFDDSWNWTFVIACSVLPSLMYLFYVVIDYIRIKHNSNDARRWVEIATVLLVMPFATSLYLEQPYDYQIISIPITIVLATVIALITIIIKRKLVTLRFSNKNQKKTKNKADSKT
jgi:hypothetical protein